ncbi:MAG: OadG family protein [Treponema sp.]|jgi:oxaloacetate decarboxylase gamma subunit|nr:OadG family protein [Treponema sp.]
MTIAEMLGQSGVMTLLGMGTVFGFLVILIIAVTVMGKIIHTRGIAGDTPLPAGKAGSAAPSGAGNAAVTAAISAAVNEYRKNN